VRHVLDDLGISRTWGLEQGLSPYEAPGNGPIQASGITVHFSDPIKSFTTRYTPPPQPLHLSLLLQASPGTLVILSIVHIGGDFLLAYHFHAVLSSTLHVAQVD
jgi:hypothetical protein